MDLITGPIVEQSSEIDLVQSIAPSPDGKSAHSRKSLKSQYSARRLVSVSTKKRNRELQAIWKDFSRYSIASRVLSDKRKIRKLIRLVQMVYMQNLQMVMEMASGERRCNNMEKAMGKLTRAWQQCKKARTKLKDSKKRSSSRQVKAAPLDKAGVAVDGEKKVEEDQEKKQTEEEEEQAIPFIVGDQLRDLQSYLEEVQRYRLTILRQQKLEMYADLIEATRAEIYSLTVNNAMQENDRQVETMKKKKEEEQQRKQKQGEVKSTLVKVAQRVVLSIILYFIYPQTLM